MRHVDNLVLPTHVHFWYYRCYNMCYQNTWVLKVIILIVVTIGRRQYQIALYIVTIFHFLKIFLNSTYFQINLTHLLICLTFDLQLIFKRHNILIFLFYYFKKGINLVLVVTILTPLDIRFLFFFVNVIHF